MVSNSLNAHNDSVTSINIINNVYCVSTGHDGAIKLWDLRNYTCLHELSVNIEFII
jgi:WD40 repeat protein